MIPDWLEVTSRVAGIASVPIIGALGVYFRGIAKAEVSIALKERPDKNEILVTVQTAIKDACKDLPTRDTVRIIVNEENNVQISKINGTYLRSDLAHARFSDLERRFEDFKRRKGNTPIP